MSERTVVQITGSGRSVYRGLETGAWYWQCDMHHDRDDADSTDEWGMADTWAEVMDAALAHAAVCPFVSASSVR